MVYLTQNAVVNQSPFQDTEFKAAGRRKADSQMLRCIFRDRILRTCVLAKLQSVC